MADRMSLEEPGTTIPTVMKSLCLRDEGEFSSMDSEKMDVLIVKVLPLRVDELIDSGEGLEFNIT